MAKAKKPAQKPAKKPARKPVRKPAAKRTATLGRGPAPRVQADSDAIASLETLKDNLQITRRKLLQIDPDTLNDQQHAQWSDQVFQVNLAISTVRNALLGAISAAFDQQLPSIEKATAQLTDDLSNLQTSVDVINAIGSVLAIISSIAALAA
jgi:hypothetical protein